MRLAQKFEIGLERIAKFRRVRKELEDYIKDSDDAISNSYKNMAIGMVQGEYEQIISRHSIFLYLRLERFLGDEYNWESCSYWSSVIFRLVYQYLVKLQEDGEEDLLPRIDFSLAEANFWYKWLSTFAKIGKRSVEKGEMTDDEFMELWQAAKDKVSSKKDHSFEYFFYGRPIVFGDPKWKVNNFGCGLSRWLYGGGGVFQTMFGVGLMKATKLAIQTIIKDVEHGSDKWEEVDIELAGRIYSDIKQDMNDVDLARISAGEKPIFKLPIYGV